MDREQYSSSRSFFVNLPCFGEFTAVGCQPVFVMPQLEVVVSTAVRAVYSYLHITPQSCEGTCFPPDWPWFSRDLAADRKFRQPPVTYNTDRPFLSYRGSLSNNSQLQVPTQQQHKNELLRNSENGKAVPEQRRSKPRCRKASQFSSSCLVSCWRPCRRSV